MNDRQLLELVAKAAGLTILGEVAGRPGFDVLDSSRASGARWWSPLTDDGDALRLAVKVNLAPSFFSCVVIVSSTQLPFSGCEVEEEFDASTGDAFVAARRAITRAAAAIGEAMP